MAAVIFNPSSYGRIVSLSYLFETNACGSLDFPGLYGRCDGTKRFPRRPWHDLSKILAHALPDADWGEIMRRMTKLTLKEIDPLENAARATLAKEKKAQAKTHCAGGEGPRAGGRFSGADKNTRASEQRAHGAQTDGGGNDAGNIRIYCRLNNSLHADQTFERKKMARMRDLRKREGRMPSITGQAAMR